MVNTFDFLSNEIFDRVKFPPDSCDSLNSHPTPLNPYCILIHEYPIRGVGCVNQTNLTETISDEIFISITVDSIISNT